MRFVNFVSFLVLVTTVAHGQIKPSPVGANAEAAQVKGVVERFCKMEVAGQWVSGRNTEGLSEFFISYPSPSASPHVRLGGGDSVVIDRYTIGEPQRLVNAEGHVYYKVTITYFYWGSLDGSLVFRYSEGASPAKPTTATEDVRLLYTDEVHEESEGSGQAVARKISPQWRMDSGSTNNVSADAAIRYVTAMSDKSSNPLVKTNARLTISELKNIAKGTAVPNSANVDAESPEAVFRRFWEMEESGKGLTPQGWESQAQYLAMRPASKWKQIAVIANQSAVFKPAIDSRGGLADFTCSYAKVGYLDSSMRLKVRALESRRIAPSYQVNEAIYTLRLSQEYWQVKADGSVEKHTGPLTWRIIEADPPAPWITIDKAIDYVKSVRDTTKDSVMKKNAEGALTILKRFQ